MKYNLPIIRLSREKMISAALTGFITFISVSNILAAIAEKNVKSKIENVTVFTNGAQVFRSSPVTVGPGITVFTFENLEPSIESKSIQVAGTGNFVIMDVQHSIKYPEAGQNGSSAQNPKNMKHIRLLEDSLVMMNFDLEEIAIKQEALAIEKNTLLNNRMIKGETKRDTLNLLKDAMVFLREKLNNINSELMKLKKEQYAMTIKKQKMQDNLVLLNNYNLNNNELVKDETKYLIIVTVSAETSTNGTITLNYMMQNAGWTASYDLRAKGTGGNMQLTYKAQVFQNTGIDWNDVKLTLSTANPNENNTKPTLNTWWLSFYNPNQYRYPMSGSGGVPAPEISSMAKNSPKETSRDNFSDNNGESTLQTIADYTVAEENVANVEYEIKLPYTIPSDGNTHFVAVQTKDIVAEYTHFAAPKLDKDAFLVAKIKDWDELNLAAGNASIYFDGTFVGESYINPGSLTDTLDITLGRDKNIVVTRIKQKDKIKEKIVGDDKMKLVSYEITVRNTKSSASNFNLQDQMPVSPNKEVVVTLVESSGAEVDTDTGILNWKMNIKPKETKKVTLTYSITFPKDKTIAGL
jgi:uncharacterized protein (TIGR02231 family)